MIKLDYGQHMEILIKKSPIKRWDIYFFEVEEPDTELLNEYQKFFNFSQGWLNTLGTLGIHQSSIFFNPLMPVNAKASSIDNHYIISINKGTIETLWQKFHCNSTLFEIEGLEEFRNIQFKSDWPFNELMFQLCCQFTFYHELGHLIQKSELLLGGLSEDFSNILDFNLRNHLLEYDADGYSAICIATHVYQYIEKWCTGLNKGDPEIIISAICSSIFVYIMMFESTKIPFYIQKGSHPHPLVRVMGIVDYMVGYILFLDQKKNLFELNEKVIIEKLLYCSKILSATLLDEDIQKTVSSLIADHILDAVSYSKRLKDMAALDHSLALNKRNEALKK